MLKSWVNFWELARDRIKNSSDGGHQGIAVQSFLGVLVVPIDVAVIGDSDVGVGELLAKLLRVWSNLIFVDDDDLLERLDKFLEVDLVHDSEEDINYVTEIGSDEFNGNLVIEELRNGEGSLNFYGHVRAVEMLTNLIASRSQVVVVGELEATVFLVDPACSGLHDRVLRNQVLVDELLEDLLKNLRVLGVVDESLVKDTKSIEESLIVVSLLLLLEVIGDVLHVFFKMCA